MTLIHSDVI